MILARADLVRNIKIAAASSSKRVQKEKGCEIVFEFEQLRNELPEAKAKLKEAGESL